MRSLLVAGTAMLLAVSTAALAAQPDGPRASSENNWPGMTDPAVNQYVPVPAVAPNAVPVSQPHYVWQEAYDHHGRFQGHWVLAR